MNIATKRSVNSMSLYIPNPFVDLDISSFQALKDWLKIPHRAGLEAICISVFHFTCDVKAIQISELYGRLHAVEAS